MNRLAVFFVYVWPEPISSAAGVRTRELLTVLRDAGWRVAAVSPSGASAFREALEAQGFQTLSADPNDSAAADSALASLGPASMVVYDRFVMEEQFGWRARAQWPEALHVVDTQDLHSLRRGRELLARTGAPLTDPSPADLGEDLLRELSSLYRADAAFVVSDFERDWLVRRAGFPAGSVVHLPFSTLATPAPRAGRKNFCFLGNFRHAPNLDAVRALLALYWPAVRARLPQAELHLYGAYPPAEISCHKGRAGVFAQGPVLDHRAALAGHLALLSPLRFGAGIKGKVLEAWGTGTPVVGSALSFEGLGAAGLRAESPAEMAALCGRLADEEDFWARASEEGLMRVRTAFSPLRVREGLLHFLESALPTLPARRAENLVGQMLRHHSLRSTKYFSRWIEAKQKSRADAAPLA